MARRIPRPLNRREHLYGADAPRQTLVEYGEAYLEQGLIFDAVEFYGRAKDEAGLKAIRATALEKGDAFLLRKVQEAMPGLVSAQDWETLGESAAKNGKQLYVERAKHQGTPPPPPLQEEAEIAAAAAAAAAESEGESEDEKE